MDDMVMANSENNMWMSISTGSSFTVSFWVDPQTVTSEATDWSHTGDFNGDGMADIAIKDHQNEIYIALSTGNKFAIAQEWQTFGGTANDHEWNTADFDGDGLTDVILKKCTG
eukprot:UN00453